MEEPPLKRPRVDQVVDKKDEWDPVVPSASDDLEFKYTREADVGITEFLNRDFEGFDCILKYRWTAAIFMVDSRYSDFLVNEVGLDGEVVVLKNTKYDYPDKHRNSDNSVKNEKVRITRSYSHISLPHRANKPSISLHYQDYSLPEK